MRRLVLAVVLAAAACAPARRQGPPLVAFTPSDESEAVSLERLERAEKHYEKGLAEFRAGRIMDGQAELRRSFSLLTAELQEDALPTELRKDFLSMLEKVRAWQGGEETTDSALDVPAEELKSVPAAKPAVTVKPHAVPIDPDNKTTRQYIHIYTHKRKKSVEEALGRSRRYRAMIEAVLREAGLPQELFYLVMAESEYKPKAFSRSGAAGLWQFMPFTGRRYGLEVSFWVDERFDPEKATKAAVRYLTDLYQWFGDWHLAVAAYNRGEHGIGRDLRSSRSLDFDTLAQRGVLPGETRNYVPKFMACVLIGESPGRYGLSPRYERPTPYEIVKLPKPLDLKIAAKAAKTTEAVIKELNPELRAWATPKNKKDYPLRIPKGIGPVFLARLEKVKNWTPGPGFVKYKVKRGDYLGRIARRYKTTVKSIVSLNKIKNVRLIRPGMVLKVRPGRGYSSSGRTRRSSSKRKRRKRR